jgi:hypothetical protein
VRECYVALAKLLCQTRTGMSATSPADQRLSQAVLSSVLAPTAERTRLIGLR